MHVRATQRIKQSHGHDGTLMLMSGRKGLARVYSFFVCLGKSKTFAVKERKYVFLVLKTVRAIKNNYSGIQMTKLTHKKNIFFFPNGNT